MILDSIDYGFEYSVTFEYELGYLGDYNNPPETHEINVISILDYETDAMIDLYSNYKLLDEVEDYINDYLNNL